MKRFVNGLPVHLLALTMAGGLLFNESGDPGPGDDGGGGGGGDKRTVDYETYQRVVNAKQGLEDQVGQLKRERDSALEKAATADTLAAQLEETKKEVEGAKGAFSRFKAISSTLGTSDPEAVEAVEWQYNKIAGDDKPSMEDWLKGMKEKPEEAPLVLKPFLSAEFNGGGGGEGTRRPKERDPNGAPPSGADKATDEKLKRMLEHARKTGDWSEYETYRQKRAKGGKS